MDITLGSSEKDENKQKEAERAHLKQYAIDSL